MVCFAQKKFHHLTSHISEMEMRKLHMGTMSYGSDSMDEVTHQLAVAFGVSGEQGVFPSSARYWLTV